MNHKLYFESNIFDQQQKREDFGLWSVIRIAYLKIFKQKVIIIYKKEV